MKLSVSQLRNIIKEEVTRMLVEEEGQELAVKPGYYYQRYGGRLPGREVIEKDAANVSRDHERMVSNAGGAGFNVFTNGIDPVKQTVKYIMSSPFGNHQVGRHVNADSAVSAGVPIETIKKTLLEVPGVQQGEVSFREFLSNTSFKKPNPDEQPVASAEKAAAPAQKPAAPAGKTVAPAVKTAGGMNKPASPAEKLAEARRRR